MGVMKDDEYSESLAVAFLCAVAVALTYVCMYKEAKHPSRLFRLGPSSQSLVFRLLCIINQGLFSSFSEDLKSEIADVDLTFSSLLTHNRIVRIDPIAFTPYTKT